MFYDLNIRWTPSTPPAELENTLLTSHALGYSVVALNHQLAMPIASNHVNPIDTTTLLPPPPSTQTKLPKLLTRATITMTDPSHNHRLPTLAAAYDLLAVRPTTKPAFDAACTSLADTSLISLDLATSFPFHFRPKPCMAAVKRGLRFEVCYGQLLGAGDARARSLFIGNLKGLVRATGGRGIVVSSEARGALQLRGPADVVNLMAVWGLGPEKGGEALSGNARGVVVNEGLKKRGYKGVVDVVQAAGVDDGERAKENNEKTKGKGKGKGKMTEKNTGLGVKRKADGPPGADDGAGLDAKPMSKKQAKRLRKAEKEQHQQPDYDAVW